MPPIKNLVIPTAAVPSSSKPQNEMLSIMVITRALLSYMLGWHLTHAATRQWLPSTLYYFHELQFAPLS